MPDLLFRFRVMEEACFFMSFLAWGQFVAGTSLQCWPHRPQPAWLWGSGMHKAGSLSPSSLLCQGNIPSAFPGTPEGLGVMLPAGLGLPRKPHPTFPLWPPRSRTSRKGPWVHPSITATCRQPRRKLAESKRLFWWGVRGGGEHGGLMPAALLTVSLWLPVLAGRCQPAGEGCHHPGHLWVLGRAAKLGLAAVLAHVWLRPGGVTPPCRPKCCHTKLPATD